MVRVEYSLCVIPFKASEVIRAMVMSLWKERHLLSLFIIYIKYERISTVLRHGIHILSCFNSPLTPSLSLIKAMIDSLHCNGLCIPIDTDRCCHDEWLLKGETNIYIYIYIYIHAHMKREEKTKRVEYIFKKTNHKECLNRILFPMQKHFSYKKLGKHRCFHVITSAHNEDHNINRHLKTTQKVIFNYSYAIVSFLFTISIMLLKLFMFKN
jgi:hypothetical protein